MSKKNKELNTVKSRDDVAFNVIYRVVTAVIALLTFPVMFFKSLYYLAFTLGGTEIYSKVEGDTGATFSSKSIYDFLTGNTILGKLSEGQFKPSEELLQIIQPLKNPAITVISLFASLCLIALVIFVFAAFTRKKLPIVIAAGIGVLVLIAIPFAFGKLEAPLIDGRIDLVALIAEAGNFDLLRSFPTLAKELVGHVDFLKAGDAYVFLWLIFAGILVWTGSVILVDSGDKPKKAAAKKEAKK